MQFDESLMIQSWCPRVSNPQPAMKNAAGSRDPPVSTNDARPHIHFPFCPAPLCECVLGRRACIIIGRNMHKLSYSIYSSGGRPFRDSRAHRHGVPHVFAEAARVFWHWIHHRRHHHFKGLTAPRKNAIWVSTKRVFCRRGSGISTPLIYLSGRTLFLFLLCLLATFYSLSTRMSASTLQNVWWLDESEIEHWPTLSFCIWMCVLQRKWVCSWCFLFCLTLL